MRPWRWLGRVAVVLVLCALAAPPAGAALAGQDEFDRAIAAFNSGEFEGALRGFLAARRAGLDTPGLHFNLGATYYRLHRYAEAKAEFQALAHDPQWAALAHYNLGLTARRMGDASEAQAQFELAQRAAGDPNLRALAGAALGRSGAPVLRPRGGSVISLSGGYDSNPALATGETVPGGRAGGDYFAEALAVATRRFGGGAGPGWSGYGVLLARTYFKQDEFDVQALRAGAIREADAGRARYGAGGYYGLVYLDGALLEQAAALELRARRRLDAGRDLRARYELARVDGGHDYGHLDGWQQRLSADAGVAGRRALWRAGYELIVEDRRDLRQGAEFVSYSPTRHTLFATAIVPDLAGWRVDARLEYRASRYRDPYVLDGGATVIERRDRRYGLELRGRRGVGAGRSLFVECSGYRSDSSIDTYDYRRAQLLVGVEFALKRTR